MRNVPHISSSEKGGKDDKTPELSAHSFFDSRLFFFFSFMFICLVIFILIFLNSDSFHEQLNQSRKISKRKRQKKRTENFLVKKKI